MGFRRTTTAAEKERRSSSGGREEEEGCCGSTRFSLMAATPSSNDSNNNNNKDSSNNHQIQFQHQAELLLQQQISYHGMMQSPPQPQQQQQSNHGNFMCSSRVSNKGEDQLNTTTTTTTTTTSAGGGGGATSTGAYDFGELDQALFMYLDQQGQDHHHHHHTSSAAHQDQQRQNSSSAGIRPPTLNIFPSQPMHVEPSSRTGAGLVSLKSGSGSKRPSELAASMELTNLVPSRNNQDLHVAASSGPHHHHETAKSVKREGNRKGLTTSSSEHEGPKTPDPKTLRRLAQNREAARKSRLRKKAYVQQLESSRIKLTQLEQELQRARSQGVFLGGGGAGMLGDQGLPLGMSHITSEAAVFDMEYSRWLDEHHRLMCELQAAVQDHLPENELRLFVDNCLAHYDEMIGLKSMAVKTDVFHLVSGMWKTPAERCFMWMGGFRPSELIKVLLNQIEPLTEQQILGICGLQQSTQEAEEALTQGLDALHQSLSDTIASDALTYPSNMANYMGQMAIAMNKLSTLEGFVRQADSLRHQTLHRLHQVLTTHQAARCFLAIAEYFHRLRALSSLWLSRPRQDQ